MDIRQISCLLVCFIFYVIVGAVVFMMLESNEHSEKDKERSTLNLILAQVDILNSTNTLNHKITENIYHLIKTRQNEMLPDYEKKWGFFNSIFFSITVVTTVGYGHLSPVTMMGRIFCMVYAIFGIPMTGILLGSIGERFSKCFLVKFKRLRKASTPQLSNRLLLIRHVLLFFVPWFIVFLIIPSILFKVIENWSFIESLYYCFITLTTIGFGDLVIGQFDKQWVWLYKIAAVLWIIFGLAYLSMILNLISSVIRSRPVTNVVHSIRRISSQPKKPSSRVGNGSTPTPERSPDIEDTSLMAPAEISPTNSDGCVSRLASLKIKKCKEYQRSQV